MSVLLFLLSGFSVDACLARSVSIDPTVIYTLVMNGHAVDLILELEQSLRGNINKKDSDSEQNQLLRKLLIFSRLVGV